MNSQPSSSGFVRRAVEAICAQSRQLLARGLDTMEDIPRWAEQHAAYTVYSFDVFDTLLRRKIDPPEEVKRLVAQHISERLARSGIHKNACQILAERDKVENRLRQDARSRGMDASAFLDDIMAGTLKSIGANGVLNWQEMVNYELALEKAAIEAMPGVRELLTCLRSMQKRIVAMSETYLSTAQMASILEHHDLLRYFDALYLSCDLGKSKLTGNLFRHVLENEEGKVVHIGDHYTFDYQIPRRLKIKALWFHSRREQRRKRELRKLSTGQNRLAYINAIVGSANRRERELFRIGHDVFGPALTLFVHCVAERARKDGIERVYFVARDGFALKKIYQLLQNSVYADTGLPAAKYLCLSRLAVRSASISADGLTEAAVTEAYRYMVPRVKKVSLRDVLASYGLEPDSFAPLLARHGLDAGLPLADPADGRVRRLLHDDQFIEEVMARSRTSRRLLREYLAGVGFMRSHKIALVDATSEGLTQAVLARVFSDDKEYPSVHGYYFTLLNLGVDNPTIGRDVSTASGLVNDWRTASVASQRDFRRFGLFVELFSHPNHGLTIGYRKAGARTIPVFRRTSQETQYPLTSQGLEGILAYARTYATCYRLHRQNCQDLLEEVKTNIGQWVDSPPREHVAALRGLFVTSDWPMETRHPLMNRGSHLSPTMMCRTLFHRRSR